MRGFIAIILKNYFGFTYRSRLCAHTYCEVDYFRKDPADAKSGRLKSQMPAIREEMKFNSLLLCEI